MSKLLSTSETLALLDELRGAIRDFAAREETLNREFRNVSEATEARFQRELAAERERARNELASAQSRFAAAKEQAHQRFSARERRLAEAHGSARRTALEAIQKAEDRRKYGVQKGTLDVEKGRADALARNDAALAEFNAQLADNRQALAALEHGAYMAFRGYRSWRKPLLAEAAVNEKEAGVTHLAILERLRVLEEEARADLATFKRHFIPRLFRLAPLWCWFVLAIVCAFGLAPALNLLGVGGFEAQQAYSAAGIGFALVLGIFIAGLRFKSLATRLGRALSEGRSLHNIALVRAQEWHASEVERIKAEAAARAHELSEEWDNALKESARARERLPDEIEDKWRRIRLHNDQFLRRKNAHIQAEEEPVIKGLRESALAAEAKLVSAHEAARGAQQVENATKWQMLQRDWEAKVRPLHAALASSIALAQEEFAPWDSSYWREWLPPEQFRNFAPFARLEIDLTKFAGALPQDPRLPLPEQRLSLPMLLSLPREGSLLFETPTAGKAAVFGCLNSIIFRLLASAPLGKISFTIFDPVGLGENFAGITHLADYEANLLNGRIWTQPDQIEQRLADLSEHMEKVIQMYLRNEYETIADYNLAAGNIAEKYHFVVLADFPVNFTESAARRLLRIVSIGARCGVYTLIHWDPRHGAPPDYLLDELRKNSLWVKHAGQHFVLANPSANPGRLLLDSPPPPEIGNAFLENVGNRSRGSNRVEVPFQQVTPDPNEVWSLDTADEVRIPIGRSGPNKLQYLALGRGTRQHALVAGKTGSGKSTLFHVIITNASLWCSPEQIEFYLVDFKKGVEFKAYATRHLPHARVVAIESDREFAVSVLQRVDDELRRRGELFRSLGVQDIAGYRKARPSEPMPRTLLIIDEFQEFFVEEDRLAQSASMLLDRIVRQGRAFGIHVILGSQTLGGVYTLARSTIGQMVVRIALQSNEADAYLIMDENNAAPRLLSRPGEGIYNDMAGAVEANSPFQAVWISDAQRDEALKAIRGRAKEARKEYPGPISFEGNAPADLRENEIFAQLLSHRPSTPPALTRVWLGAPNSIKDPTHATFRNRSGNNLLIVGQREDAILAMTSIALVSLAVAMPTGSARVILFDSSAPGSPARAQVQRTIKALPGESISASDDLAGSLQGLDSELTRRLETPDAATAAVFLIVHGLQNFKKLRPEDDFSFATDVNNPPSAAAQFTRIYTEGPSHGIHVIASIDSYNNVNRFLGRKGLSEFEMRVLFQMSSSDSASLCDDPRASQLGLYRALYYNEQEGTLETFRPYAAPDPGWLASLSII